MGEKEDRGRATDPGYDMISFPSYYYPSLSFLFSISACLCSDDVLMSGTGKLLLTCHQLASVASDANRS